jgi:hypothetical protein
VERWEEEEDDGEKEENDGEVEAWHCRKLGYVMERSRTGVRVTDYGRAGGDSGSMYCGGDGA